MERGGGGGERAQWQLAGRVAVVTGGSSGIGEAVAAALTSAGVRVVVADLQPPKQTHTGEKKNSMYVKCDVTRPEDIKAAIDAAKDTWGRLDIMVNNAGISGGPGYEFPLHQSSASWRKVIDINLTAVIEGTQQAIKAMESNEDGGVIVNVASMGGIIPIPQSPVYGATKAGVVHLARSLTDFGRTHRIRVNAICPSFVDTPLVRENPDEVVEVLKQSIGGRLLQPSDVAQGVLELVRDPSLVGAVMRVTVLGGRDFWPPKKARL